MAFTTWSTYYTQVLDLLVQVESGFLALSNVTPMGPDGVAKTFRNLDELRRYVDWVKANKVAEDGATDGRGRRLFLGAVR